VDRPNFRPSDPRTSAPLQLTDPQPIVRPGAFWRQAAQIATVGIFLIMFCAALDLARVLLLPITSAIVIGIMLGPLVRVAADHRIPSWLSATAVIVLMLLLFYSIQIWLNHLTDFLGWDQIDIDPFVAGVVVLGFIYGAYFTETFRGAFLSVPRGQLEAGAAYGMTPWQTFSRIMFPQMMRFALPGIGNNWQVMVKATALVSIIGLADVVKAAQDAGKGTLRFFFFTLLAGAVYLVITTLSNLVLMWLERRYSSGVRKADL